MNNRKSFNIEVYHIEKKKLRILRTKQTNVA